MIEGGNFYFIYFFKEDFISLHIEAQLLIFFLSPKKSVKSESCQSPYVILVELICKVFTIVPGT